MLTSPKRVNLSKDGKDLIIVTLPLTMPIVPFTGRHSERQFKVHGGDPLTPGAIRLICGMSPRVPESQGKHREERNDNTISFAYMDMLLAWPTEATRIKTGRMRRAVAKLLHRILSRLVGEEATAPLYRLPDTLVQTKKTTGWLKELTLAWG